MITKAKNKWLRMTGNRFYMLPLSCSSSGASYLKKSIQQRYYFIFPFIRKPFYVCFFFKPCHLALGISAGILFYLPYSLFKGTFILKMLHNLLVTKAAHCLQGR